MVSGGQHQPKNINQQRGSSISNTQANHQRPAQQFGTLHSKNKTSILGQQHNQIFQDKPPERSSAANSLRGASSTIGRAGEQIMGSSASSKKSPGKANPRSNDLHFQVQSITSSQFGAVHGGGTMSFMNSKAPVLGQEAAQGLVHNPHTTTNDALGKREGQSPGRKAQNGPGGFPNR
jgi:hypothetical protein